ncbi:predicted protein [Nematostella vectensis]|uniref:peptidyl-tRNA hydrolase n=2 Tax=Nematostella vectensis TaxID=45351 RepID=A7SR90_NEMVE|nr:predicted protein [Nematostella vectensis]|eukprot:XP_001625870.1 predicted protein [Nematostella vectensis]
MSLASGSTDDTRTKASGTDKLREYGEFMDSPEARLFLCQMTEMGLSENASVKGLYYTHCRSVDEATSWVFDNMHLPDINEPLQMYPETEDSEAGFSDPYKMAFVVNSELNMGVGKVAAQVGHAAVGLYRALLQDQDDLGHMLMSWEDSGGMKVVLKGENTAHLLDMETQAKRLQLPFYLVQDAGRTQIASGSVTVLGIFGATEEVNKITGKLRLL